MLAPIARLAFGRRRRVLVAAAILLAVAAGFGVPVAGKLSGANSNFEDSGSESVRAREALERASGVSPDFGLIALVEVGAPVSSSEGRRVIEDVASAIAADPAVARVLTWFDAPDPAFLSRDGGSTYVLAAFGPLSEEEQNDAVDRIEERFADEGRVLLGGALIAGQQVREQVEHDLARAEALVIPILLVVSLVVFRGLVAALLPVVCGLFSIAVSFLALRIANEITDLSVFALNLVTGMCLGLAIDYSLFVLSRYREELVRSGPGWEALRRTVATAGRTVAYSALIVAVATSALLVFPQPFLYSMGIGGIFASLASGATALIVLPAILALLGGRVNALAPAGWQRRSERIARAEQMGFWYRLAQGVMRRPGRVAIACAAFLVLLGIPFSQVEFTSVDASVLPGSASARQVSDALKRDFPPVRASPIYLAVAAPASEAAAVGAYAQRVRALPGVAAVLPPRPVGRDLWELDVVSRTSILNETSLDLVREIRGLDAPFPVLAGGLTAGFIDQQQSLGERLPWGVAIIATGAFLLLLLLTGSVVLPFKALVMNLLALSATFGVLVLIFQDGNLEGLLDFTSQGALEATQPILLFTIAFALSTDYAVFLLTRIKEARDAGHSNTEAVAIGLERTGRIVTAAALLFCVAIGAFSASEIVFIKLLGLGTALAVALDATIVRALLVPALMKMLGDWNWWAPPPLRRLTDRLGAQ